MGLIRFVYLIKTEIPYRIRMTLQKIFREDHYSDNEAWDFFSHNTKWALPKLVALKDNKQGYPADLTEESWRYVLNEIIFAFMFQTYDDYEEKTKLEKRLVKELIIEPFGDVREYISGDLHFEDCTDKDKEGYVEVKFDKMKVDEEKRETFMELYKRMQKGFELYGKYYLNLWD